MGEVDPSYQSDCLKDLRGEALPLHAARMILWSTCARIMADRSFYAHRIQQAGVYLEAIFGTIDAVEGDEARHSSSVPVMLDMGNVMGRAFFEMHTAEFHQAFDPTNRVHQGAAIRMQLTVNAVEQHMANAYRQYRAYELAQAQDPTQTDVTWY